MSDSPKRDSKPDPDNDCCKTITYGVTIFAVILLLSVVNSLVTVPLVQHLPNGFSSHAIACSSAGIEIDDKYPTKTIHEQPGLKGVVRLFEESDYTSAVFGFEQNLVVALLGNALTLLGMFGFTLPDLNGMNLSQAIVSAFTVFSVSITYFIVLSLILNNLHSLGAMGNEDKYPFINEGDTCRDENPTMEALRMSMPNLGWFTFALLEIITIVATTANGIVHGPCIKQSKDRRDDVTSDDPTRVLEEGVPEGEGATAQNTKMASPHSKKTCCKTVCYIANIVGCIVLVSVINAMTCLPMWSEPPNSFGDHRLACTSTGIGAGQLADTQIAAGSELATFVHTFETGEMDNVRNGFTFFMSVTYLGNALVLLSMFGFSFPSLKDQSKVQLAVTCATVCVVCIAYCWGAFNAMTETFKYQPESCGDVQLDNEGEEVQCAENDPLGLESGCGGTNPIMTRMRFHLPKMGMNVFWLLEVTSVIVITVNGIVHGCTWNKDCCKKTANSITNMAAVAPFPDA